MQIRIKWHEDMWQEIKNNAMFTIHKDGGKYPDSVWKKKILLAEHSPIRSGRIIIEIYDIPSFVIGHLVRHNVGFTPFVASLREDRTEYDTVPDRNTPNNVRFDGNFQSFINISRKRLCLGQPHKETRRVWEAVRDEIVNIEPELASCMVRECVYRGFCPEMKPCGFFETELYQCERGQYVEIPTDKNDGHIRIAHLCSKNTECKKAKSCANAIEVTTYDDMLCEIHGYIGGCCDCEVE